MKEYYEVRRLLIELLRANPFIRKDQYNGENGDQVHFKGLYTLDIWTHNIEMIKR